MKLDSKIPQGSVDTKWTQYKSSVSLVNPANKRSLHVIVVGTGLAGASAAATLAEMGYKVSSSSNLSSSPFTAAISSSRFLFALFIK